MWQYLWYRSHYWDRVDFDDPSLVRDGAFDQADFTLLVQGAAPNPRHHDHEAHALLDQVLEGGQQGHVQIHGPPHDLRQ